MDFKKTGLDDSNLYEKIKNFEKEAIKMMKQKAKKTDKKRSPNE